MPFTQTSKHGEKRNGLQAAQSRLQAAPNSEIRFQAPDNPSLRGFASAPEALSKQGFPGACPGPGSLSRAPGHLWENTKQYVRMDSALAKGVMIFWNLSVLKVMGESPGGSWEAYRWEPETKIVLLVLPFSYKKALKVNPRMRKETVNETTRAEALEGLVCASLPPKSASFVLALMFDRFVFMSNQFVASF